MLYPVRCFSCNACVPSDRYDARLKHGETSKTILDALGVTRMCCRRMLISHPHALEDMLLDYPNLNENQSELFLDVRCLVSNPREVGCE